ncbi:MAG: hypothetical protein K2K76_04420 [Muribaculaceae bacterium]|nr:hypothetical protein [Muribaculaceae bacterium]
MRHYTDRVAVFSATLLFYVKRCKILCYNNLIGLELFWQHICLKDEQKIKDAPGTMAVSVASDQKIEKKLNKNLLT